MSKKLEILKKSYQKIEIPRKELKLHIQEAIDKGERKMKKHTLQTWSKRTAAVAAVFVLLIVSVNTIPTLARSIENIPILGQLVKVLIFNDAGVSEGGEITDGANVENIELITDDVNKEKDSETEEELLNEEQQIIKESLIIDLTADKEALANVPHYTVEYNENPSTLTFTLSGVRGFSAEDNFKALKESTYISDIYKLITLDDSTVRFNIVFNQPIQYKISEYKVPAQILIDIEGVEYESQTIYSLRTGSYPFGESFAIIEEQLFSLDKRVLKDVEGMFTIEIGNYQTEEEATQELIKLKDEFSGLEFYVEERMSLDMPQNKVAK